MRDAGLASLFPTGIHGLGTPALCVSEQSALRTGSSRHEGLRIHEDLQAAQEAGSGAAVHRLDEPTGLSLGVVASERCRLLLQPVSLW